MDNGGSGFLGTLLCFIPCVIVIGLVGLGAFLFRSRNKNNPVPPAPPAASPDTPTPSVYSNAYPRMEGTTASPPVPPADPAVPLDPLAPESSNPDEPHLR